jgi:hypothetical protein
MFAYLRACVCGCVGMPYVYLCYIACGGLTVRASARLRRYRAADTYRCPHDEPFVVDTMANVHMASDQCIIFPFARSHSHTIMSRRLGKVPNSLSLRGLRAYTAGMQRAPQHSRRARNPTAAHTCRRRGRWGRRRSKARPATSICSDLVATRGGCVAATMCRCMGACVVGGFSLIRYDGCSSLTV